VLSGLVTRIKPNKTFRIVNKLVKLDLYCCVRCCMERILRKHASMVITENQKEAITVD